ncbi:MAG: cell wall hydrolase [Lachnospiraceae bacterium]|nr:cell wall hydrolase [Lachnospiraceae bacterium]
MNKEFMKCALAGSICFTAMLGLMSVKGYAEETIDADTLLLSYSRGVAEVLDANTTPTKEEVQEAIEEAERAANAWKEPGAMIMANVTSYLNVRQEPSTEGKILGQLYCDCGGEIIEYGEDWTMIRTGSLEGWVSNEYIYFGDEAREKAEELGTYKATVLADTLNVRKAPSTESTALGTVKKNGIYDVLSVDEEGWVLIDFNGTDAYVSSEYVDVEFLVGHGETNEEIAERKRAEEEAKRAAEIASNRTTELQVANYGTYAAQATDLQLIAAVIQCEGGNQPYEGQQAIAAVIMNRVRSPKYPNTVWEVISAPYQFTVVASGAVDRAIQRGLKDSCLLAAQDAINGYSPVGAATQFRPISSGRSGIVIGGHVFW